MTEREYILAGDYKSLDKLYQKLSTANAALTGLRKDYDLNNCRANKAEQQLAAANEQAEKYRLEMIRYGDGWVQANERITELEAEVAELRSQKDRWIDLCTANGIEAIREIARVKKQTAQEICEMIAWNLQSTFGKGIIPKIEQKYGIEEEGK